MIHGGIGPRGAAQGPGAVPLRPRRARPGRHRRRRRGHQPPARPPDGQLRPALEPEPARAAVRPHPPHRPDRGLPPLEPGRRGDPRGRRLPPAAREARGRERGPRRPGLRRARRARSRSTSLRDLLIEAIRYGDQPEVRARLDQRDRPAPSTTTTCERSSNRNALAQETMSAERLFAVKEEMERAEARRLQPHFVASFFLKAFDSARRVDPSARGRAVRDHPRPGRHPRARPPDHRPQPPRARAGPQALRAHLLHQGGRSSRSTSPGWPAPCSCTPATR